MKKYLLGLFIATSFLTVSCNKDTVQDDNSAGNNTVVTPTQKTIVGNWVKDSTEKITITSDSLFWEITNQVKHFYGYSTSNDTMSLRCNHYYDYRTQTMNSIIVYTRHTYKLIGDTLSLNKRFYFRQ